MKQYVDCVLQDVATRLPMQPVFFLCDNDTSIGRGGFLSWDLGGHGDDSSVGTMGLPWLGHERPCRFHLVLLGTFVLDLSHCAVRM